MNQIKDLDLNNYHYCSPHPDDNESAYLPEEKFLLGERYGGRGVGDHSGVRCGLDGDIQIKGVGRNILAGKNSEFLRSHGGVTLSEAIREPLWGEICHHVLPLGLCRINFQNKKSVMLSAFKNSATRHACYDTDAISIGYNINLHSLGDLVSSFLGKNISPT